MINNTKKLSSLPADVLGDGTELTKTAIQQLFPKKPFSGNAVIKVFHAVNVNLSNIELPKLTLGSRVRER